MPSLLACLVLAAPPADAVQPLDLGRLPWTRALSLDGRPVRVRFVVDSLPEQQDGGDDGEAVRLWREVGGMPGTN
jgi:hypothetical protein